MKERVFFFGHRNIRAQHYNTIEITKGGKITPKADCIIGVRADKACNDLSPKIRQGLQTESEFKFEIVVNGSHFFFNGWGSPALSLKDVSDIVLRKSLFASERTCAIKCAAGAADLPRSMVKALQDPMTHGLLNIEGPLACSSR